MLTINPGEVNEIEDFVDLMRQQFFDAVLKASIEINAQKLKPKALDTTFEDLQKKCERKNEVEHKISAHEEWLRDKAGRMQADADVLREILVELGAMRYEAGVDPTGMRGG